MQRLENSVSLTVGTGIDTENSNLCVHVRQKLIHHKSALIKRLNKGWYFPIFIIGCHQVTGCELGGMSE